jgi:hypothetical protein
MRKFDILNFYFNVCDKGIEVAEKGKTDVKDFIPFLPTQASNHIRALLLEQDRVVAMHLEKHFSIG